jgi:HEAT repeat protein
MGYSSGNPARRNAMNVKEVAAAILVAVLTWAGAAFAEQVEVVADSAKVKVGEEVIASVKQGERFTVLRREGPWVAITVDTAQGEREGWILATRVRTVVEPGMSEDSRAPDAPELIQLRVSLTQVQSAPHALYFKLAMENRGVKAICYNASDFVLHVDGQTIKAAPVRTRNGYPPVYVDEAMRHSVPPQDLDYLDAGEVTSGDKAVGWLRFEFPPGFRGPSDPVTKAWILSANLSGRTVELDLKDAELKALRAKVRPSSLDESVQVVEVGSRINAFNVGKLVELVEPFVASQEGCVILMTATNWLVDDIGRSHIRSLMARCGNLVVWGNVPVKAQLSLYWYQSSGSESAAVMKVLGQREGTGPTLARHLTSPEPETRWSAAQALAGHTAEPGVVDALVKAAADEDATVRSVALYTLADSADPKATQALLRAMADPETDVRSSAARAACEHKAEALVEPLIGLLDDSMLAVEACAALGALKSDRAVPKLKELQTSDEPGLAAAAIDALHEIGVLSEVEAALSKLEVAQLSFEELDVLTKAKDPRIVPKLVEAMEFEGDSYYVGEIARALGEIGDKAAVEPLIDVLRYGSYAHREIALALGKLGDGRAIQPLRDGLREARMSHSDYEREGCYYEALLMLEAPGVLEELTTQLEKGENSYRVQETLEVLGRGGGNRAIPVIEPFLDDESNYSTAVWALLEIASPEALAPIKKRLLSKGYPYASEVAHSVASGLVHHPTEMPSASPELARKRLVEVAAFLRELAESPNPNTRSAVAQRLYWVEREIAAEHPR